MVEASPQKQKVLITGITGYLGSHVTKLFINDDRFQVRGTVRSKTNMKKIQPLKDEFGAKWDEVDLVEADLLDSKTIEDACEGMDIIIHTASPFPSSIPKHESELIKPAVEGTLAAVRGCHKYKCKRIVITSSIVSIVC
jgi:nucleoside-diphosphate-sugar epimerase